MKKTHVWLVGLILMGASLPFTMGIGCPGSYVEKDVGVSDAVDEDGEDCKDCNRLCSVSLLFCVGGNRCPLIPPLCHPNNQCPQSCKQACGNWSNPGGGNNQCVP
jgi:hypothetical protein